MDCFSCANPATGSCKRCAKTYCEDHGNAQFCADCLRPSSAVPSSNLYFGALLVMLVGTALAVYLLVRPPGDSSGAAPVAVGRSTATATSSAGTPQPTVQAETPVPTPSPQTPTPAAEPTAQFLTYTVQEGDNLFSIAEANVPAGDDIIAYLDAIVVLNGFPDADSADLQAGDTILLPPLPQ